MARAYQPHERFTEADRDKIAGRLRDAFADGRLDQPEFNHRLDRLYAVTTYGELEPLVRDLPQVRTRVTPAVARDAAPRSAAGRAAVRRQRHPAFAAAGGFGSIVVVNVVIWAVIGIAGGGHFPYFWPIWLLIPWAVVTLGALGKRG